jgi:hypothetical protein
MATAHRAEIHGSYSPAPATASQLATFFQARGFDDRTRGEAAAEKVVFRCVFQTAGAEQAAEKVLFS